MIRSVDCVIAAEEYEVKMGVVRLNELVRSHVNKVEFWDDVTGMPLDTKGVMKAII